MENGDSEWEWAGHERATNFGVSDAQQRVYATPGHIIFLILARKSLPTIPSAE